MTSEAGSGSNYILIEPKCRRTLHSRFDLHEESFAWRDDVPAVTLYWRAIGRRWNRRL